MAMRGLAWRAGAGALVAVLLGVGAGGCGGRRAMCERAVAHVWESNIPEEVHALLVALGTSAEVLRVEGDLRYGEFVHRAQNPAAQLAERADRSVAEMADLVDRCVSKMIDSDAVACFAERPPSDLRPCAVMSQARQGR